ncbi:MAG: DNA-3-methyladenine glycosylase 2 family protein, partial [Lachnospiraceae bacterium]|nr:DNA-3-methyladenine glycosylase 2 family protein [Lachnospiraceae bacterium]
VEENVFNIFSVDKMLRVKAINNNTFDFDCSEKEFKYYSHYFDLSDNYDKYSKLCKKSDKFLKKCIEFSNGLRILNQDKFEMIISFIISQRKSVKAIQTSIERMCKLSGKKIKNKYGEFYAFPSAKEILKLSKSKLLSCGMGYRTDYIIEFCKDYIAGKYDLEAMNKLPDEELLNTLLSIKGVGVKVASCVALFAYHRMSICPIDVWIARVLDKKYNGKIPKEYEKYAGMIQQYWFNYTRINKI